MTNGLTFETEEQEGKLIFRLSGRLDATSSPNLESKVTEQIESGHKNLVLDFGNVEYLSSAGMRLLLSATRRLANNGGKLCICTVDDEVMEIIKVAGFERILNIYSTEKEALSSF